jgi:Fur family ferric uptake transcriptional regulator
MAVQRSTRQRSAIRAVLDAAGRPLSPLEVQQAACQRVDAIGIATVYRALKALLAEGVIQLVRLPGESPRYESAAHRHHHHHFQCTRCERVFDVPRCPGNLEHAAPEGFVVESHEITLYGCCPECRAPAPAR